MIKWLCLCFSYIFIVSSHSWLFLWLRMEINSLSFIPIMIEERRKNKLKYFLIQSVASVIFSASILNQSFSFLIPFALLIKIGAAPFHIRLVSIYKSKSWKLLSLLITFQKIGPLLRLVMMFSSVRHLSWLIFNIRKFFLILIYYITYLAILYL